MLNIISNISFRPERPSLDFFEYWESLGFFDNLQVILPPQFFIIFEIARVIFTPELISDALNAVEDILREETIKTPDRDESILINRMETMSPLSENMEIDNFRTLYELKKTLPKELAMDDDVFNIKLLTKTLQVQKFYESEYDQFKPISTSSDESGREANRFDQKFYLLLDRSRSMDFKMRSFFSKCLIAEFLRRKLNSNAKLYFRPFDSKVGSLFKIENKDDFPLLIEHVLLTTTSGTSTNLQDAIIQAIHDINYDKDMIKAEILVVTDGISRVDKFKIINELGEIKLNILKIGRDLAEPNFFDVQNTLENVKIDFDPYTIRIDEIKRKLSDSDKEGKSLSTNEKRAFRYLLNYSEKMFMDLKDISHRFIEIQDIDSSELFKLTDENLDFIGTSIDEFSRMDFTSLPIEELQRTYKQAYFLNQYIELIMEYGENYKNPLLKEAYEKLKKIRQKMLQEPSLLEIITHLKGIDEDKETLKLSKKDAKEKLKEIQMFNRSLSSKELKKAQLLLTMDIGEGNLGQFIKLLLIKLWDLIKTLLKK